MKATTAGFIVTVGVALLFVGLFFLSALLLMLLVNVVLGHYEAKLLDYTSALAITLLLVLFGGVFRAGGKE